MQGYVLHVASFSKFLSEMRFKRVYKTWSIMKFL